MESKSKKLITILRNKFTIPILILFLVFVFYYKMIFFLFGGSMISFGILLQAFQRSYNLSHVTVEISPEEVYKEIQLFNKFSSYVKDVLPSYEHHPLVIIILCMDSRISTEELLGDSRDFYYVIRTAGSVIREKEMEMIELALVEKSVKSVIFTEHSDCAARKVVSNAEKRNLYPSISRALADREREIVKFLERPVVFQKIKNGQLLVKHAMIDTKSVRMFFED